MCEGINPSTFMMLAICSAPRQVMLHPVKSTFRILVEYLTLWQMTAIKKTKISKHSTVLVRFCFCNSPNIRTL